MINAPSTTRQPRLLRFMLKVGRWAGFAFVPDQHVQVIYRMGIYRGVKGPGLFRFENFLSERLGSVIDISPQAQEYTLSNLLTRDNLTVTLRLKAMLSYDPRQAQDRAPSLTRMTHLQRMTVPESFINSAALKVVNLYTADQLTQHTLRPRLEHEMSGLTAVEIKFLGFNVVEPERIRILQVTLPERIKERHELIAQRRLNILASSEFMPEDLRRALIIEVLERLGQGGGKTTLSFNEALESFLIEDKKYTRYIEQPTLPRNLTLPNTEPPPGDTPPASTDAPAPRPDEPPKPRGPRSRL